MPCLHRGQVVAASNSRAFIRQVLPNKCELTECYLALNLMHGATYAAQELYFALRKSVHLSWRLPQFQSTRRVRAGGVASTEAEWAGWATEAERAVCRLRRRRASSVQVEASLIRLQTTSVRRPSPRRSLGGGVIKIGLSGDARRSCFRASGRY